MGGHDQPAVSRRRVVTTAGHLAWSAPLIVAATAVPAAAMSLNGAAVMVASGPTYTPVFSRVRASSRINNVGTVTPSTMTVTVTITPEVGSVVDADPTFVSSGFVLLTRLDDATTGRQTLTFRKLDPQIAPGQAADLTFDFFAEPGALEVRRGNVTVLPSVPAPGTSSPGSSEYLSVGNPPA